MKKCIFNDISALMLTYAEKETGHMNSMYNNTFAKRLQYDEVFNVVKLTINDYFFFVFIEENVVPFPQGF